MVNMLIISNINLVLRMSIKSNQEKREIQCLYVFGKNLQRLRDEKGFSQEDLAGLAELDRTYISGIENGKRNIGLINLFKLAKALEIEPKDLLDM